MPVSLALQTQISAIKARIDAVAASATPEDIVMLAKAIEAIGGQATVFDVMAAGDDQIALIGDAISSQLSAASSAIGTGKAAALAEVSTAKNVALAELNPQNFSRAAVQAAILSL